LENSNTLNETDSWGAVWYQQLPLKTGKQISISLNIGRTNLFEYSIVFYALFALEWSLGCRNSFFVFVSDRSRFGLAENLGQIRFS